MKSWQLVIKNDSIANDYWSIMQKGEPILKYGILIICIYLLGLVLWPFMPSIVFAVFFASIFTPLFRYVHTKWHIGKTGAAIITVSVTVLFIFIPIATLIGLIAREAVIFAQSINMTRVLAFIQENETFTLFGYVIDPAQYTDQITAALKQIGTAIYTGVQDIGRNTASFLFSFFVCMFLYFYFLKDGTVLAKELNAILPFENKQKEQLIKQFRETSHNVFTGHMSVALISGALAWIGFAAFNIPAAIVWALLVSILSFIPTIGTFIVYCIAVLMIFFLSGTNGAFGLAVYYIIAEIGIVSYWAKPKLLEEKIHIHPILVFCALTGGVHAFGSGGILYGPLIMILSVSTFEFLLKRKTNE